MATDSTTPETQEKPKTKTRAKTKAKRKTTAKKREPRRPNDNRPQRDENGHFSIGNTLAAKWTERKALNLAKDLLNWMKEDPRNFWMKDFLLERDLYDDVIDYLSDKYPRFSDYIKRAKGIQASRIQKFAMMNQLNPGMAQWVLSVHHKLRVKSEVEVSNTRPVVVHVTDTMAMEKPPKSSPAKPE